MEESVDKILLLCYKLEDHYLSWIVKHGEMLQLFKFLFKYLYLQHYFLKNNKASPLYSGTVWLYIKPYDIFITVTASMTITNLKW